MRAMMVCFPITFGDLWKSGTADKTLTEQPERARTSGNRQEELWTVGALARLHRFSGERAQALQFLQKPLDISVEAGHIRDELKPGPRSPR